LDCQNETLPAEASIALVGPEDGRSGAEAVQHNQVGETSVKENPGSVLVPRTKNSHDNSWDELEDLLSSPSSGITAGGISLAGGTNHEEEAGPLLPSLSPKRGNADQPPSSPAEVFRPNSRGNVAPEGPMAG
ncbi:unnamed protein product, partial [Discosporangium mesarthrocarpum]